MGAICICICGDIGCCIGIAEDIGIGIAGVGCCIGIAEDIGIGIGIADDIGCGICGDAFVGGGGGSGIDAGIGSGDDIARNEPVPNTAIGEGVRIGLSAAVGTSGLRSSGSARASVDGALAFASGAYGATDGDDPWAEGADGASDGDERGDDGASDGDERGADGASDGDERGADGASDGDERGADGASDGDERGADGAIEAARGAIEPAFGAIESVRDIGSSAEPSIGGGASLMRVVAGAMLGGALLTGRRSLVSSARARPMSGGSACAVAAFSRLLIASASAAECPLVAPPGAGALAAGATPTIVFLRFARAADIGRGIRAALSALCFRSSDPNAAPIQKLK